MLAKGIITKDVSGRWDNPGGLVINGSPTKERSTAVQSLLPGLGELAAVL
jgi:hypothetical protein